MKNNHFYKLLKNKNFLRIWLSQVFSLMSAASLTFVLIGKIFASTQSSVAVGLYLFFYYLPTAILGPFVGALIDNWNKKVILMYSNLIQAVLVLLYLITTQKIWPIYCMGFLYSLGDEFYNPTVSASIPSVVVKDELTTANSLFFITSQGSIIAGIFIGGILLKFLPSSLWVYPIISTILIISTVMLIGIPQKVFGKVKKVHLNIKDPNSFIKTFDIKNFLNVVKEGYSFIQHEPLVMFPILLLAGLQVLVGVATILLPSLTQMIGVNYADSSFLIILPALLGALAGGWLMGHRKLEIRKYVFIFNGLYILGISLMLLPFLRLIIDFPTLLGVILGLSVGFGYVRVYLPLQTLIQEHTPFKVRGRVFTTLNMAVTLAAAIPIFITTTLADLLGARIIFTLLGLGIILLSFFAERKKELILNFNNHKK